MCCRRVRLLLWRNCVRRKRAPCAAICELCSPVVIVILFTLLFFAFTPSKKPAAQYLRVQAQAMPLAGYAYRLAVQSSMLALGACVGVCAGPRFPVPPVACVDRLGAARDLRCAVACCRVPPSPRVFRAVSGGPNTGSVLRDFNATLAEWYPALNPLEVFGNTSLGHALPSYPGLAPRTMFFSSDGELRRYIRHADYGGVRSRPKVSGLRLVSLVCASRGRGSGWRRRTAVLATPASRRWTWLSHSTAAR
jgi:hypothetical protein